MRTLVFCLAFLCSAIPALARHGKGGMLTYEYLGAGSGTNTSQYRVTATHYIDCDGTQFTESAIFLGVFDGSSKTLIRTITISKTSENMVRKTSFGCINPAPDVCFSVATYVQVIELANNENGYILAEQECCRIQGIQNIINSSSYGSTYSATIPGGDNFRKNSNPQFAPRDTAVICYNSPFILDFSATDKDGDQLSYEFCAAEGGGTTTQRQPNPPAAPPYGAVPYAGGFAGGQPLGPEVNINPLTGIISGIAPRVPGKYIVSVCVTERRNGVVLSVTKKEVQVEVANCNLSAAMLPPQYVNCKSFTSTFENQNYSSEVVSYSWDFGVAGTDTDVSTAQQPTFTYPDTGRYVLKLKVSTANGCTDSTTSEVLVYPGFDAGFTFSGSCFQSPFQFTDTTKTRYGEVSSWQWRLGNNSPISEQNPSFQFATIGDYRATLIVRSSKGCADTISKTISVTDRPNLALAFKDTLVCDVDALQLKAIGNGDFSWKSTGRIKNANTATPLVFPTDTTKYVVTLNEKGCVASDTVTVNVLPFITVKLPADTTICRGDSIMLRPESHALQYRWLPGESLNDAGSKFPMAAPQSNTEYRVIANLGRCQDEATMRVKVVPYPQAFAGADTLICYNTSAQLNGNIVASSYRWTHNGTLQNANTLTPIARPLQTTSYILTVSDTQGCPKEVSDTVVVRVEPQVFANAGNDTAIVAGQPLQLAASGGDTYSWQPATGLNNPNIANPVAFLPPEIDSITYRVVVGRNGCFAEDDLKIVVYKLGADILVPSGFTPNGDGRNDLLKPILIGMKNLEHFRIYNRWGQLVFQTQNAGQGWDGRIGGVLQGSGVFIYMATGTTFDDRKIVRKGTVMLIR